MIPGRSLAIANRARRRFSCTLLLGCVVVGCASSAEPPESTHAQAVRVRVAPVGRGDMADLLTVTGETAALSTLRLASPVAGRITALSVRPGDHLAKNEIAVQVITFENEAALRGFTLLEETTHPTHDERQLTQRLRKEMSTRTVPLRVPFAAVVAERLHNPGELVAQNDVLLEVFDPSSLYVIAQVPADAAGQVRPGAPADVDLGEKTLHGEVAAIITALTPQTLTVPVRVALSASPEPALLHAAVRCRIQLAHDPHALTIPGSALVSSRVARRGTVMVAVDSRAQRRTVELGMRSSSRVEVRDGLRAGELVLVDGQYALPDGTPIEAVQSSNE
jgi:multidrug efflux pump subunit AcrA (membrane-fusion protein)